MFDFIRLGDALTGGGKVISASGTFEIQGRGVARLGDRVICLAHPSVNPNLIVVANAPIADHGRPVAHQGDKAACGCALISSL